MPMVIHCPYTKQKKEPVLPRYRIGFLADFFIKRVEKKKDKEDKEDP